MKKSYLLITSVVFALSAMNATAQSNIIKGGDMEASAEEFWKVSSLANDPTSVTEYSFGYTEDAPSAGENGCLHFSAVNTGTNGSHIMFYQEVTLKRGVNYQLDFAAKAMQPMNNSWLEVYIGGNEPVDGADYGTSNGAIALGGFKWSGWEAGCAGLDEFDATLNTLGCMGGSQDLIFVEGEGDTIMYVGFKAGIWATATTIEIVVDNVSLTNLDGVSVKSFNKENLSVYPNPVGKTLGIATDKEIVQARILNISGKEVLKVKDVDATIDVTSLKQGIYMVELKDNSGNTIVRKFTKQ